MTQRRWLTAFGGAVHGGDISAVFEPVDPVERAYYFDGLTDTAQEVSIGVLLPELLAADLPRTARRLDVPVYFFLGRHDQNTPADLAVEYFDVIEAPHKEVRWFEHSAHLVPFGEPARFDALMIRTVLGGAD